MKKISPKKKAISKKKPITKRKPLSKKKRIEAAKKRAATILRKRRAAIVELQKKFDAEKRAARWKKARVQAKIKAKVEAKKERKRLLQRTKEVSVEEPVEAPVVEPVEAVEPEETEEFEYVPTMDVTTPQLLIDAAVRAIETLAEKEGFEVQATGSILADGSAAVEATFYNIESIDRLLAHLSETIQHLGRGAFKASIMPLYDPSKIVKPFVYKDGQLVVGGSGMSMFEGMAMGQMNVTADIPGSFLNARMNVIPQLEGLTGLPTETLRVVLLAGESIMGRKVSRKVAANMKFFTK